jgi:hypothetical protein
MLELLWKMRLFLLVGLLFGLIPVGPAAGVGLTLEDLNTGASFTSGNNALEFSNFSITPTGSVTSPLSDFQVIVLDKGFEIVDTWSAFGGEVGGMTVEYTVTTTGFFPDTGTVLPATWLSEAMLSFTGAAVGEGSEATVTETLETYGLLEVYARGDGVKLLDVVGICLACEVSSLNVVKQIDVISGPAGTAQISLVTQQFEVVPEPGTVGLFVLGVGGLLLARRRS